MSRNFGIVTSRPASSGAQLTQTGSHSRAGQRDLSNVINLADRFPGRLKVAPIISDEDMEVAAFAFAALWGSPFILMGIGLIIYSLFIA